MSFLSLAEMFLMLPLVMILAFGLRCHVLQYYSVLYCTVLFYNQFTHFIKNYFNQQLMLNFQHLWRRII